MKRVLNLYAGIGGNRKLWENVKVTAVELNPEIAAIYRDFFPDDEVIVADAHQFLLEHYVDGWDFIWSSPPCPSHSRIRNVARVGRGQEKPIYPDMKLYEEIIFLEEVFNSAGCDFDGKYCVENVRAYYEPLVIPQERGRHYFWANFHITDKFFKALPEKFRSIELGLSEFYGFDVSKYEMEPMDRRRILRNCVHPDVGLHILDCAFRHIQSEIVAFDEKTPVSQEGA